MTNASGAIAGGDVDDVVVTCGSCGNAVIDEAKVIALELEWITAHSVPDTFVQFYANSTLVHIKDGSNEGAACAPTRSVQITTPYILDLVNDGINDFRVVFPARIGYAKVRVHRHWHPRSRVAELWPLFLCKLRGYHGECHHRAQRGVRRWRCSLR